MNVYIVKYTIILYCSVETFKERTVMGLWKYDIMFHDVDREYNLICSK